MITLREEQNTLNLSSHTFWERGAANALFILKIKIHKIILLYKIF